MKEIEIDLSQPFQGVLEAVLALPNRTVSGASDACADENELRQAVRGLYEAANGRQVETEIGLIAIAPPIAPFLKAVPFRATTLKDFLVAAAVQIVSLPLYCNGRSPTSPREPAPETKNQSRLAIEKANDWGAIRYAVSPAEDLCIPNSSNNWCSP